MKALNRLIETPPAVDIEDESSSALRSAEVGAAKVGQQEARSNLATGAAPELKCKNCGLSIAKIIDPWGYDNYRGIPFGYYHTTLEREANIDGADVPIYATFCPDDLGQAEPELHSHLEAHVSNLPLVGKGE